MKMCRDWVHSGCPEAGCSSASAESPTEQLLDTIMLQLRLAQVRDREAQFHLN